MSQEQQEQLAESSIQSREAGQVRILLGLFMVSISPQHALPVSSPSSVSRADDVLLYIGMCTRYD